MTVRFYSSVAQQTNLTNTITPTVTSIMVADATGFPGSTPFTLALDYGAVNEELVNVTDLAGTSMTVDRGIDGTSATAHAAGAIVRHVSSARDFADSRAHENASTNVHGLAVGSSVVGTTDTQTLSNKTLADTTFADPTITGTVEGGATYDGITLTGTIGAQTSLNIVSPATSAVPLSVTAASGQTANLTEWRDSTATEIARVGSDGIIHADRGATAAVTLPGNVPLVVTGAPSQTANLQQWKNNGGTTLGDVDSTGQLTLNRGLNITQGINSGTVPLTVKGATGQTEDIFQLNNPAGTVRYLFMGSNGDLGTDNPPLVINNGLQVAGGPGEILFARKTADTARANTATGTLDPHLFMTLDANSTYIMDAFIIWGNSQAGDILFDWTVPASATGSWTTVQPASSTSSDPTEVRVLANGVDVGRSYGISLTDSTSSGLPNGAIVRGVVNTTSSGTYGFQWAQFVSNATATIVYENSWLKMERVA